MNEFLKIFALKRGEQRVVLVIAIVLVAITFAKRFRDAHVNQRPADETLTGQSTPGSRP